MGMTTYTNTLSRSTTVPHMQAAGTHILAALLMLLIVPGLASAQQRAVAQDAQVAAVMEAACAQAPRAESGAQVVIEDDACGELLTAEPDVELLMARAAIPDLVQVETTETPDAQESAAVVGWGGQPDTTRVAVPPELANILEGLTRAGSGSKCRR